MTIDDEVMMTRKEVADFLGMTKGFLEAMARRGEGPRFCKISPRRITYRRSDVMAWLESMQVTPTPTP